MARQYKRTYELTATSKTGEVRIIRNLRIIFEITKSVLSFPNLARIEIYNPNSDTISVMQERYSKISLSAGYEGNIKLLFKGEIRNSFETRSDVDKILVIYAGDGERDYQNSVFNKTFTESVSISQAIQEVLDSFEEITIGVIDGLPTGADKLRGQTLSGSSKDILDQFAEEYGFDWSIQDGEVIITPLEQPITNDEAVLISAATGMVNSPTITEVGVDVTTLLNPQLLPNRAFKIESLANDIQLGNLFFRSAPKTVGEGVYKIQEVTFKGDTRDGQWLSIVKGRAIA